MLIALFLTFRGLKEGVTKLYEIQEKQLSDETIKELQTQNCAVTYPVNAEDGKLLHYVKFFFTKIAPPAIVITCFITFLIYR